MMLCSSMPGFEKVYGVVSHGAQIGGHRVFADHTCKNKRKMRPHSCYTVQRFKRAYLHAQTPVHMHLTNHDNFEYRKNLKTPNLSPMPG